MPRTFPDSGEFTCAGFVPWVLADTISSGTLVLDGYGGFSIDIVVHGGRIRYVDGGYTVDSPAWTTCQLVCGLWRVESGALQLGVHTGVAIFSPGPMVWTTIMAMPPSGKLPHGTTLEFEGKTFARR